MAAMNANEVSVTPLDLRALRETLSAKEIVAVTFDQPVNTDVDVTDDVLVLLSVVEQMAEALEFSLAVIRVIGPTHLPIQNAITAALSLVKTREVAL